MRIRSKNTQNTDLQNKANEQDDWKWLSKLFPVITVCICIIILGPYLLHSFGFFVGIKLGSFCKVLVLVLPVQVILCIPIFYTYRLANSMADFKKKLLIVNWKFSYFFEAIFCELLLIVPLYSIAILSYWLASSFKIETSTPVSSLLKDINLRGIITIFFLSVFIAPWIEEIIFRRIIFSYIKNILGIAPSILITSFVFAIIHGGLIQILPLALLGLVLQFLYIKHNSIFPSVLLHSIHNFMVMSFVLIGWSNRTI